MHNTGTKTKEIMVTFNAQINFVYVPVKNKYKHNINEIKAKTKNIIEKILFFILNHPLIIIDI